MASKLGKMDDDDVLLILARKFILDITVARPCDACVYLARHSDMRTEQSIRHVASLSRSNIWSYAFITCRVVLFSPEQAEIKTIYVYTSGDTPWHSGRCP